MKQLFVAVVSACFLVGGFCSPQTQGPQIGFCNTYQTTQNFDEAFISKMQEEAYSFLLTSGPTHGCQKLNFFANGTFTYDFIDVADGQANATGSYQVKPFSFTTPATITLSSLPFGELGSILGTTNFNVLVAEEDLLVLVSCVNIGLIRTQQVHVLIPESISSSVVASEVNTTVQSLNIPLAEHLVEVQQDCYATPQTGGALSLLNRLYTRLGFLHPSIPISGYGDALYPGFQPAVGNAIRTELTNPHLARQAQAGFYGHGSQLSSKVQPSVYSAPLTAAELSPQILVPQAVPYSPVNTQLKVEQFSNPNKMFSGLSNGASSFSSPSHFAAQPVVPNFVTQAQPIQQNKANQPVPIAGLKQGAFSSFY